MISPEPNKCWLRCLVSAPLVCACVIAVLCLNASAGRLPIRQYTSADGLGSGFTDYVFRDAAGFVWTCTRDGLSRFDGTTFQNFRVGLKDSAPGIESIYQLRDGRYLISTTNGTYLLDPQTSTAREPEGATLDAVRISNWRGMYLQDSRGDIWIASGRIMKLVEKAEGWDFTPVEWNLRSSEGVTFYSYAIDETPDGSLWIITTWGLIRRLPGGATVQYLLSDRMLGGAGGVSLNADSNGLIWLAVSDKVFVIKPEPTGQIESQDTANPILLTLDEAADVEVRVGGAVTLPARDGEIIRLVNRDFIENTNQKKLFQSASGDIWISAGENLLQISNGVLQLHDGSDGLPSILGPIAEDSAGNLWIGGHAALFRINSGGLTTYGTIDGAGSNLFFSIAQRSDGALFFGHPNGSISYLTGDRMATTRPATPPNPQMIWTTRPVFVDSSGEVWQLTSSALYRFRNVSSPAELDSRSPDNIYTSADGLKSDGAFQIFEDSRRAIWVSTRSTSSEGHGLARLEPGKDKFEAFSEDVGYPSNRSASSFAEDEQGNVWVGFYEGGLVRFNGTRFEPVAEIPGFPNQGIVTDMAVDSSGALWIATSLTGVYRIDNPAGSTPIATAYRAANGLASDNIRTLAIDGKNNVYAGSARGVDRISSTNGRIKHYSVADGLAADFVVDSLIDRAGNVWFATYNGLSKLAPRHEENAQPPPVFISGVRIAGTDQPVSDLGQKEFHRGELDHTQSNLEVDFFGLDLRAGESLRYQYLLEGAGTEWSVPTTQRTLTFANLQPAQYRFLVRAVNSDGAVSENPAVVTFTILRPVWSRWWFMLLTMVAVIALVVWFFRYRTARLREINLALAEANRAEENLRRARDERLAELETVRSRIATDLHDDIGASLTKIAVLSQVARAQANDAAVAEPLSKISDVSNELVGAMSDIVWSINPAKEHVSDLTQRMRRFASDILSPLGIGFTFDTTRTESEKTLNTNVRREVFLIFKEAVNNIVKHSAARRVKITLDVSDGRLEMSIEDDGRGFVAPNVENDAESEGSYGGTGLKSIRRRAGDLGGELDIDSEVGEGTELKLSIPIESTERP